MNLCGKMGIYIFKLNQQFYLSVIMNTDPELQNKTKTKTKTKTMRAIDAKVCRYMYLYRH